MKKLFLIPAFVLSLLASGFAQVPIYSTNLVMIGTTSDTTINVKAVNNPISWRGRLYRLPANGTNYTTTNGIGFFSLVPGLYTAAYAGIPQSLQFSVTNSDTALNLTDLITAGKGVVFYSGVETIEGTGGLVVTPPTGSGGKWIIDASGITGGSGSGNVTGPNASTVGEVPYFDQITGQHLGRSGILYTLLSPWANWNTNAFGGTAFRRTNEFVVTESTAFSAGEFPMFHAGSNSIAKSGYNTNSFPLKSQTIGQVVGGTNMGAVTLSQLNNGTFSAQIDGISDDDFNTVMKRVANFIGVDSGFGTGLELASNSFSGNIAVQIDAGILWRYFTPASGHTNIVIQLPDGTFAVYDLFALRNGANTTNLTHSSTVTFASGGTVARTQNADGSTNYALTVTAGGSGTVTSVDVAKNGHTSSGAVTGAGTITLTRTATEDFLGFGANNLGFLTVTNQAAIRGLVVTNGLTNLNLTATADVESDSGKGIISLANGSGFKTNNGSGGVGWYPDNLARTNQVMPLSSTAVPATNTYAFFNGDNGNTNVGGTINGIWWTNIDIHFTNYGATTNIVLPADGNKWTVLATNGPHNFFSFGGNNMGAISVWVTTNGDAQWPPQVQMLGYSNHLTTNCIIDFQPFGGTNKVLGGESEL